MAKEKKFEFAPLPTAVLKTETPPAATTIEVSEEVQGSTKVTFDCPNEWLEKMKDYGYWEGLTQKDIILESLEQFFADKTFRERPQKVKERPKVGRKPKS